MAYVKVLRGRNIFDLNKYMLIGRDQSDPYLSNNCFGEDVADQMYLSQISNGKRDMDAIHVVQSFDKKDSKKLSPEEYTKIGFEMTHKMFPEHEFIVVTHTDTEQTHNHIMINPYHPETGKKIQNKKRLLYDLRDLSDKYSHERGLSVIEAQSVLNWENYTETVRAIKKRGGFSWIIDLQEKCDFARQFATSFDEYAGILNQFSIQVRVESKNIQYIYPGRRSKRGGTKGLGEKYTKDGLITKFKGNHEQFFNLGFKSKPSKEINFNEHWKFHRHLEDYFVPEYRYKDLVIPLETFKKIKNIDLKLFCEKSDIEFIVEANGFSLKDKPYVQFRKNEWFNSDKKTTGSPLEFISYLKGTDFLETLMAHDESGRLDALSEAVDVKKPSFQAFYFKAKTDLNEIESQKRALTDLGFSARSLTSLLKKSRIKAYPGEKLKLFPENNSRLSLTLYKSIDGWSCRKKTGLNQFFYKSINQRNKKTLIFSDPVDFLKNQKVLDLIDRNSCAFNILVPMKPVGLFLHENKKFLAELKNIFVVEPKASIMWGNTDVSKRQEKDLLKTLIESNIGYQSIDDLLKDILVKSREL